MIRMYADHIEFDPDEAARIEVLELLADRADPAFWLDAYFDTFEAGGVR
jgi:hypothetical protein